MPATLAAHLAGRTHAIAKRSLERIRRAIPLRSLEESPTRSTEAWFLGPKGENGTEFEELIVEAIRDQIFWRRNFHPGDPSHITEEVKASPDYLQAMGETKERFRELLAFLKKSVPFFSMRYQGHMNWDLTIPSMLGYFATMLYNPNNVAFEGSTATTIIELLVGDDLCRMLGYNIPTDDQGAIRPWGHITCDGTVANIEAVWSARNLRCYPNALKAAIAEDARLGAARGLEVRLAQGEPRQILEATTWELFNLASDEILSLPARLIGLGISIDTQTDALADHSVQNIGLSEFLRKHSAPTPVVMVAGTKHYSFPKAAALLGLGANQLIDIHLDRDARMDINHLRSELEACASKEIPVVAVVAVIGSTEESAIDPISSVLKLRDEFRSKGLDFNVHADAAWGGYHASLIREDTPAPPLQHYAQPQGPAVEMPLSKYVVEQFEALPGADSITVDPHKSGYIPYPAGALCYRNSAMRDLVAFSAPVVFHGEAEPTVGIYGVEGSKPGAAPAAVFLSHAVIRPSKSGYGKIIGQALYSCKRLYVHLLCMAERGDPFVVIPVPRLPAERAGGNPAEQLKIIREAIYRRTNEEIRLNQPALKLLPELGPDQNILAYAFNLRLPDGSLNNDLSLANRLNAAVYDRLSINPGEDIYGYDIVVSTTDLGQGHYGSDFIEDYTRRMGVGGSDGDSITVIRSVVMDPWATETTRGSFIDFFGDTMKNVVVEEVEKIWANLHG